MAASKLVSPRDAPPYSGEILKMLKAIRKFLGFQTYAEFMQEAHDEMKVADQHIQPVPKQIKIEMFQDKNKKWRFRLLSTNHKILCSSEAYSRKKYCKDTAELIKNSQFSVTEK